MENNFFKLNILKQIKKNQGNELLIKNFLSKNEVKKLVSIEEKSGKYFVDRQDGRKRSLALNGSNIERNPKKWHSEIQKIILPKLKKVIPRFAITKSEFPPHFFNNEFPTVMHADTGLDNSSIIYKQILIPLKFSPIKKNAVKTIIFNKDWYGPASTFRYEGIDKRNRALDFTLKDLNGNFILIKNLIDFKNIALKNINNYFYFEKGIFYSNNFFINKLVKLINHNKKRYNNISNKHITNGKLISKNLYKKYLTHQPREDFTSLKIKTIFDWKPGDLFVWDRTKIHCSNDYTKHGVKRKTGLAIFFLYPKKKIIKNNKK